MTAHDEVRMTPERLRTAIRQHWHDDMLYACADAWEAGADKDFEYIRELMERARVAEADNARLREVIKTVIGSAGGNLPEWAFDILHAATQPDPTEEGR